MFEVNIYVYEVRRKRLPKKKKRCVENESTVRFFRRPNSSFYILKFDNAFEF